MAEKERIVSVPFVVFESERARHEREKVRRFIIEIVLIILLFGSNAAWIAYESQYSTQEATVEVDTGNGDAYVAGIGDVNLGESPSDGENP